MSHSGFNGGLATRRAVDVQVSLRPRSNSGNSARHRELELKLAALQKDYADLHTRTFRSCAGAPASVRPASGPARRLRDCQ